MCQAAELAPARTVGGRDYGDNMADANTRTDSLKEDIREIGYSILDLQAKARDHDAKLEQIVAAQLAHDARSRRSGLQLVAHIEHQDRRQQVICQARQLVDAVAENPAKDDLVDAADDCLRR